MPSTSRQLRFDQALARLRERVSSQTGDMLPGERELSSALGVSRTTLRRLLAQLAKDGVVVQRQGVGTFVARSAAGQEAPPPAAAPLPSSAPLGWIEGLRRRGRAVLLRHERIEGGWPTLDDARDLAIGAASPVERTFRVWDLDGLPLATERVTRPAPTPAEASMPMPAVARTRLIIRRATAAEARDLGLDIGAPLADLRRVESTAQGRPCACAAIAVRGDRFTHLWQAERSDADWDVTG